MGVIAEAPCPCEYKLMRRDEIVFAERTRNDIRLKEKISDFRNLMQEVVDSVEPEARERLRQKLASFS